MKKRILSMLLVIAMIISMFSVSITTANAGIIEDIVSDKLIDLGYRFISEITLQLSEATDNDDIEEVSSFVSTWFLADASEAAATKSQELCKEILDEINTLSENLTDYSSETNKLIGEQNYDSSYKALASVWSNDVGNVIKKADGPLSAYKDYVDKSYKYKAGTDKIDKKEVESAYNNMIMSFKSMYNGNINISNNSVSNVKEFLFCDESPNEEFEKILSELSSNLVKKSNTDSTVAEAAAAFAYNAYPFSHQQYQYVTSVIYDQLRAIAEIEVLYGEYLYQQGDYLKDKYGVASDEYEGYLVAKAEFNKKIKEISDNTNKMLKAEMKIGTDKKITLDQYMRPEDVYDESGNLVPTKMKITNYKSSVTYTDNKKKGTSYAKYIKEYVDFNKVMANGQVYYIIDPTQFSDSNALKMGALDYKHNIKFNPDYHHPSADYLNITKQMSDGSNTFYSTSDTSKYTNLFSTNAFSLSGSVPEKYLSGYLPAKGSADTYFITPDNKEESHVGLFKTIYHNYNYINASKSHPGSKLEITKVYGTEQNPEKSGNSHSYSVVLANEKNSYSQKTYTQSSCNAVKDFIMEGTNADGRQTTLSYKNVQSMTCGTPLTIKFKIPSGYSFSSLKCYRYNDLFGNNSKYTTVTTLLEKDDINCLSVDSNGYYVFETSMPYSYCKFELNVDYAGSQPETHYISTYNDLVKASNYHNNGLYGENDIYILKKNIIVPSNQNWTEAIGTQKHPFNGSFKGNGYSIVGLNMNNKNENALFGIIGENGSVEELIMADCHTNVSQSSSAAIAVTNNGIIKNCMCGVSPNSNHFSDTYSKNPVDYTSSIKGDICGGITAVNNGMIIGCINSGDIIGSSISGGIAGINKGFIYGSANTGDVGSSTSQVTGGIVGKNYSSIKACYDAGQLSCANSNNIGSLVGINEYVDINTQINKSFYATDVDYNAIGSSSTAQIDGTNLGKTKAHMKTDSFLKELKSNSKIVMVYWCRNDNYNNGYPIVDCEYLSNLEIYL